MPRLPFEVTDGTENIVTGNVTAKTTTAAATLVAAPGAGQKFYLTDLVVINGDTAQDIRVTIAVAGGTSIGLVAGRGCGGFAHHFRKPIKFNVAATAITIALSAVAGDAGVDALAIGFYAP